MGFHTVDEHEVEFKRLDALERDTELGRRSIGRIKVKEIAERANRRGRPITQDRYLNHDGEEFQFTKHAFERFMRHLEIDPRLIHSLRRGALATELVNDALERYTESNRQLVVNQSSKQVIGVVSETYQEYPHIEFLEDLKRYTSKGWLEVTGCWKDATTVEVNLQTSIEAKVGSEHDRCIIGLRAVNDIAGRSTVKVEQSVTRLACLNGLTWDPNTIRRQTYHQGEKEKFKERVANLWSHAAKETENGPVGVRALLEREWTEEFQEALLGNPKVGRAVDGLRGMVGCDPEYRPRKGETKAAAKIRERQQVLIATSGRASMRGDYRSLVESPYRANVTLYDMVQDIAAIGVLTASRRERRKVEETAGVVAAQGLQLESIQ